MSAEALLALFALALAVYGVLPPERRLDLQLRIRPLDWLIVAAASISVHYIKFYPVLAAIGLAPDLGAWRLGLNDETASYLIIALATGILVFRIRSAPLTRARLPVFHDLVERLILERKFADLFYLVERHFPALVRLNNFERSRSRGSQADIRAHDTVRLLLTSTTTCVALAQMRPTLGLQLLEADTHLKWDFLEQFVRALLDDKTSLLYLEVRNNQNFLKGYRYFIPTSNRLLYGLLQDANRANDLRVTAAFATVALSELARLPYDPKGAKYNLPLGDYYERGKWECPFYAVLSVYDILIPEAIHQNVPWHMEVYLLPRMVELMTVNLQAHEDADEFAEWRTPYEYLIYTVVSSMGNWIKEAESVPADQRNRVLQNTKVEHQNDNIPKSIALAMGTCMRHVLISDGLLPRFKSYLLEIPLTTVKELRGYNLDGYAEVMLKSISQGGFAGLGMSYSKLYRTRLVEAVADLDVMLRFDFAEDNVLGDVVAEANALVKSKSRRFD